MTGWRRTLRRAWPGVLIGVLGCGGADGPSGPPVLVAVDVFDATGSPLQLDAAAPAPISARVSFVFRFDRLLDPTELEEIVDGKPVPAKDVARIEASGEPEAVTTYIPNGHAKFKLIFAAGPALIVSPQPTLPSGAQVLVSLDRERILGKDGAGPFVPGEGVADTLQFSTVPFAALIAPMEPPAQGQPVAGKSGVSVTFNNLPGQGIESQISIEVFDAAGAALPEVEAKVTADAADPTRWLVTPLDGSWPAGARVKVRVAREAADALGVTMADSATLEFEVAQ
jgi:hypothetical protein